MDKYCCNCKYENFLVNNGICIDCFCDNQFNAVNWEKVNEDKKMIKNISVEDIRLLKAEMDKINKLNLDNIDFYENGQCIEISKKTKDDFSFTGLSNMDFIMTNSYKD